MKSKLPNYRKSLAHTDAALEGWSQPSRDWHLGHLYAPRAYTPGSIMPGYPYLFEVRQGEARPGDVVASLPPAFAKPGQVVVAKPEALALVEYLISLDRTYPALKPLPFNPTQAKAMLKKAGVKPGTPIQIDFRGSDSNFREVAQAVASYLQGVGINASLKPYDTNVLLNDIIPSGKTGEMWQNSWGGWTFDYDNTAYAMYYTKQRWNPFDDDAKLNALLHTQRNTWDQAARKLTLQEIGRYVADQALEMPLYSLNTIYGLNKRAKNLALPTDGRFRFVEASVE